MHHKIITVAFIAAALPAAAAQAATLASDDASNAPYDDGLQNGDNGGTGFQPFTGIGNAAGSGSGGTFIGTGSDIGTGGSNEAFGVFGNGDGVGQVFRPFTGELSVGQTFALDFGNGSVDAGGTVGFALQDSGGGNLFEFLFRGGQTEYEVNDEDGLDGTGVAFTSGGLSVAVTRTGVDSYSADITPFGGATTTVTGDFAGTDGNGPSQFRVFNADGGADLFFNSPSVVPEPLTALGGVGLLGLIALRRRA